MMAGDTPVPAGRWRRYTVPPDDGGEYNPSRQMMAATQPVPPDDGGDTPVPARRTAVNARCGGVIPRDDGAMTRSQNDPVRL
ncbi:hypothetical protein LAD67_16975 [Escherichia coli]|nr:hypothetical protein [Escherichia coli]